MSEKKFYLGLILLFIIVSIIARFISLDWAIYILYGAFVIGAIIAVIGFIFSKD